MSKNTKSYTKETETLLVPSTTTVIPLYNGKTWIHMIKVLALKTTFNVKILLLTNVTCEAEKFLFSIDYIINKSKTDIENLLKTRFMFTEHTTVDYQNELDNYTLSKN